MKEALQNRFGVHRVQEAPSVEGRIPLLILDLELKSPVTVLVTNGLRDYKMPVPEKHKGKEHNEIYFCIPDYWEWEDLENPRTNWVFEWIDRLAKFVVENETWYGNGHTFPCGKDKHPISETMKQNYFMLADPILLSQELAPLQLSDKTVHFLSIIPLFEKEFEYKQGRGTFKILQKMANRGVTEKLDDFRGSVLKRRWIFKGA